MLKIRVALRVFSDTYTLLEITELLGDPDKGFSLGDEYGKSSKKREATLWSKNTSLPETDSLEAHIKEAISFLNINYESLMAVKNGCSLDLFCMLSSDNGQGGASLQAAVLGGLHNYGVGLTFDVYSDD